MRDLIHVALGSNVGDRSAFLAAARAAISLIPGVILIAASRVEETAPFGGVAQGPYLNQMIVVRTALEPVVLLRALHKVERQLGRVRGRRWGARTIDLDIVRAGDHCISTPELVLPHPGLLARSFWQHELSQLDQLLASAA